MDQSKTANSLSFKQRKGCFVQRWVLVLIAAVAVCCVLLVGLLVGYLTPCGASPRSEAQVVNPEVDKKELPYVLLPRSIIPEHYDVELQPFILPGNFTFNGKVRVQIRVLEETDNVTLHINDITVNEDSVRLSGLDAPDIARTSKDLERQFYILHLKGKLGAGQSYEVYMEFLGNLNDQLAGFYRSSYKDEKGQTRYVVFHCFIELK
ncbi:aminopeptidase N-like [Stegodyphus dumicola]|uniref:aminopeptidase N-like n=1 Tax=Stegodyphus dumicola TaxID=202533 RepID=UPI0015A80A7C|nr:aminopeptidase N-like [Stegodyphus dumicola]